MGLRKKKSHRKWTSTMKHRWLKRRQSNQCQYAFSIRRLGTSFRKMSDRMRRGTVPFFPELTVFSIRLSLFLSKPANGMLTNKIGCKITNFKSSPRHQECSP